LIPRVTGEGGWNEGGRDVAFVIGGPDGLALMLSDEADLHLAFGTLT
jgi:23S rRNA pseudoU1915 N3-methylase RlmH